MSLLIVLLLPGRCTQLQVCIEVVRIHRKFSLEFFRRLIGVSCKRQRLGVEDVHFRKIRIQHDGFGEFIPRAGKIGNIHFGAAQHQVRLGRVAVTQNSVYQDLSLLDLMVTNPRRSKHVGDGCIIWMLPLLRLQHANDVFLPSHSQIAVAQQQHSLFVRRVLGVDPGQFPRCFRDATHFVVHQGEVEPGCRQRRGLLQGGLIFRDSLFKPAQPGQSSSQVGMDSSGLRVQLQKLLVFGNRAIEIARLLLLDRVLNQFLRSLCPSDRAKAESKKENGSPHTSKCIPNQCTRKMGWPKPSHFSLKRIYLV